MPYANNDDCKLYYETFGSPSDPTRLLVNGLGSQCINYKSEWCERFVAAGFHVIRFDNRDVGLSTHFTDAPLDDTGAAYSLVDMAADAVAVLDAAGVDKAHVMGLSMGGMIVQQLAIHHRERLLTMTSVMSRTNEPGYGEPTPGAGALLIAPAPSDREGAVQRHIDGLYQWGSPEFANETRWRRDAEAAFDRSSDPAGVARQFFALRAGSWADGLPGVTTP